MAAQVLARRTAVRVPLLRRPALIGWVLPLILLVLWQASLNLGVFKAYQLPPPLQVLSAAGNLIERGLLQNHVLTTCLRVAAGFAIGASVALLLGTVVGLSRRVDQFFDPTLQAVRTVPTLAWAPLLILWLGIDEQPKLTLIAIGAFFPVYVNLVAGVRGVDRKLVEVGRIYDLSWTQIARRIVLPASLPNLLTGLRLGMSQAWLFVVVAEMMASTRGLGFMLTDSQNTARPDLIVLSMLMLAVLGKLTDMALRAMERRLLLWRDTFSTDGRPA
jgi:sulfonate transport system permease protein